MKVRPETAEALDCPRLRDIRRVNTALESKDFSGSYMMQVGSRLSNTQGGRVSRSHGDKEWVSAGSFCTELGAGSGNMVRSVKRSMRTMACPREAHREVSQSTLTLIYPRGNRAVDVLGLGFVRARWETHRKAMKAWVGNPIFERLALAHAFLLSSGGRCRGARDERVSA